MTKAIFRSIWLTAVLILLMSFLGLTWGTYTSFSSQQRQALKQELATLSQIAEQQGDQSVMTLDMTGYRLTLIAADGKVFYDSEVDSQLLSNHSQREEVIEALKLGHGESTRYSTTVVEQTVYQAQRLASGQVLRLSVSYTSFIGTLKQLWLLMLLIFLASLGLAYGMARFVTKKIMTPINQIDLAHPLTSPVYTEFSPLLERLAHLNTVNQAQIALIRQREDEFELITRQMAEGLIVLNHEDKMISLNASACDFFNIDQSLLGQPFFRLNHTYDFKQAMAKAKQTGHERHLMQEGDKIYQVAMSRVQQDKTYMGLVLLIVDVTDQKRAERLRREFTANVSHELKTPLQTIMGASELMAHGLVTTADQPRFIAQIREEAGRLLRLVEETMRLAQLDEQVVLAQETLNLKSLVETTLLELREAAHLKQIQLVAELEEVTMLGQARLLHDIIYNLVDNAIRYSEQDGQVQINLYQDPDHIYLSVKDQGMGIAEAEQARIFERFYRVDKSHSRKTGGTGLGLSIVKNAVEYHGGRIELESQLGQGSYFTVIFDKKTPRG